MSPHRIFGPKDERGETCKECGALVIKPRKHRKWHKRNRPIPGPPGPTGPQGMKGDSA